ncbi:glycine cleavage system protein R [Reinekea marinisedimentorum]|uniref:Glycine cleavage system transcriptional repressor n=1 Tax=Reinekea marinisedimentorum TaxID=230495 RepID=A0A4R3I9M6_9GAMM|nr:ACT domain-containing protein [Reinekea marinisedimentorum]TCS42090.1 glycine cleavage system regulatory protein [Reinekea marinisedimentorum]
MEVILTVLANDKPGIAESLAQKIEQYQGNWLESRMATMAGKFAGIIRIEIDEHKAPELQKGLQTLRDIGLSIQFELGETPEEPVDVHSVEVVGNDRPGIIREVTEALTPIGVNVIDLQTEIEPASMSGGNLFKAKIKYTIKEGQPIQLVTEALEELSPDLMVDH